MDGSLPFRRYEFVQREGFNALRCLISILAIFFFQLAPEIEFREA
jgi:hypothetical protein